MRTAPMLATCLATALAGCAHLGPRPDHCAGAVAAPQESLARGTLHVRAALTVEGRLQRHEAVVEIGSDSVSIVGLTPIGTQAFELRRDAEQLAFDNRVGRFLGLTPLLLFDAVARSHLAGPPARRGAERWSDTVHAGRLETRRFLPLARHDRGSARVDVAPQGEPAVFLVRNDWCGYEARIAVLSDDRSAAGDPP